MTLWLITGWLLSLAAGFVAHEGIHWTTARAVGAEAHINWIERHVQYELPETEPLWKDRLIGLSPLLVGLCVGSVALALWGVPSSRLGIFAAIAWAISTFWGSPSDFILETAHKKGAE